MDIANLILRLLMYIAAIVFNPLTITGESLVRKRFDGDNARLLGVRILNGELYLVIGLVNQQFLRAALRFGKQAAVMEIKGGCGGCPRTGEPFRPLRVLPARREPGCRGA